MQATSSRAGLGMQQAWWEGRSQARLQQLLLLLMLSQGRLPLLLSVMHSQARLQLLLSMMHSQARLQLLVLMRDDTVHQHGSSSEQFSCHCASGSVGVAHQSS